MLQLELMIILLDRSVRLDFPKLVILMSLSVALDPEMMGTPLGPWAPL